MTDKQIIRNRQTGRRKVENQKAGHDCAKSEAIVHEEGRMATKK